MFLTYNVHTNDQRRSCRNNLKIYVTQKQKKIVKIKNSIPVLYRKMKRHRGFAAAGQQYMVLVLGTSRA